MGHGPPLRHRAAQGAPGPTSVARRRRSSDRSRAIAASRATSPRFRSSGGCSVCRPSSTMSRRSSTRSRSCSRAASPTRGSAPSARPDPSCSAFPGAVERAGRLRSGVRDHAAGAARARRRRAVGRDAADGPARRGGGSFVTPDGLDLPLTFEDTRAAGATLGSGVVVAIDDRVDLPGILRVIAAFFRDESCGQCVPCRVGTVRQEEALARLVSGRTRGTVQDELALIAEIGQAMRDASICGLGQTASGRSSRPSSRLEVFDGGAPMTELPRFPPSRPPARSAHDRRHSGRGS